MNLKVRAIVFHTHGVPEEVARWEETDAPAPAADEVRVRLLAAPINPADLNVIEGKYPIRPALPGVPGVEGLGVVENVGLAVKSVRSGDRVLLPHGYGTWREAGVVKAGSVWPVPEGIATEQAAMLRINPATALRMLRDFVALQAGEWVLQNAANSAVGRAVIQIARASGWRTVNVVRRPELVEELKAAGADVVLVLAHAGGKCTDLSNPNDTSTCYPPSEVFRIAFGLPRALVVFLSSLWLAIAMLNREPSAR